MRLDELQTIVEQIGATISENPKDREELYTLANAFWEVAFPEEISDEDRHSVWLKIIQTCDLKTTVHGQKVLDVLEWPASGAPPSWAH